MLKNDALGLIFGKVLQKIRLESGHTQESLAHEAGLERTHISMLERGVRQPTLRTLIQLSSALKITLTQLIHEYEKNLDASEKQ